MKIETTPLEGVLLITPKAFADARGFFLESYNRARLVEQGQRWEFVQDNHSRSLRGVLRGLHYQRGQGKLVTCLRGEVFDVAVDLRAGSPTFGRWHGTMLDDRNHAQLWVPSGFAHGFCCLSESADVLYKTTDHWRPEIEGGLLWSDPEVAVAWPIEEPLLSDRDGKLPLLRDIPAERLPG